MLLNVYGRHQNWRGAIHTFPCGLKKQWHMHVRREAYDIQKVHSNPLGLGNWSHSTICAIYWPFVSGEWNDTGREKSDRMCRAHIELHYWLWGQCRHRVDETLWVRHADCKMAASSVTIHKQRELIYNSAFLKKLKVLNQYLLVFSFTAIVEVLTVRRHGFYTRDFKWRTREACVRFVAKNQRSLCEVCCEETDRPVEICCEEPDRPVWGLLRRTRQFCVRFVAKNQTVLCEVCCEEPGSSCEVCCEEPGSSCEVCYEEPDRPVWGLLRRTRQACVRFVAKNQRGLCEVCGEEPDRSVWDLWRRAREACVRFMEKNRDACMAFVLKTLAMRQVSVTIRRLSVAYYHFSCSPYPFIHHPPDGQWPN